MQRTGAAGLALLLATFVVGAWGSSGPTLVILGDSFSDTGNSLIASNGTIPSAAQGYYKGRFTNGWAWPDYAINGTGAQIYSTAVVGATACAPDTLNAGLSFYVPYLAQQYNAVIATASNYSSNKAVFVWIGANDVGALTRGLVTQLIGGSGGLTTDQANAKIDQIRGCIQETAENLLKSGYAKALIVSTVQNIALQAIFPPIISQYNIPAALATTLLTNIGNLVRRLNVGIRQDVNALAIKYRRAKATITVFDTYSTFYGIEATPVVFNFTNTSDACLQTSPLLSLLTGTPTTPGDPNNKVVSTCPNPGNYLWWDYSHPTTAAHSVIGGLIRGLVTSLSKIFDPPSPPPPRYIIGTGR